MKRLLAPVLLAILCCRCLAQRESIELSDGWKFIKHDVAVDAAFDSWENVTVPHTWNAFDGQTNDPAGYYRGPAWYTKKLDIPSRWEGRRVFVRFEAASLVADVYLNGKLLGQHRGGFTAFCFELTPNLLSGRENILRVRVDNSLQEDVPPLRGDFTVSGGIYRPAHLLVTDPVCISPLDFASPGVYLTQRRVDPREAMVDVETMLSSGASGNSNLQVNVAVRDAAGLTVAESHADVSVSPGAATNNVQTLTLPQPHLWNGRKDPYLYSVTMSLSRNGRVFDEVTQPLGLRTVQITEQQGFLLNGQPYPIHGVTRHQERRDKGWALSQSDHDQDHQMIFDIGATAIRLAHYPQSDYFAGLCDHSGILLWQEIPVVDRVIDTPAFRANAHQQLMEMLQQYRNHPAFAFWGLFNELYQYSKTDPPESLIADLKQQAHDFDTQRIIVAASDKIERTNLNTIPDWIAFNIYPNWYPSSHGDFAAIVDRLYSSVGNKRVGISEYGAGANIYQHEEGEVKLPKTNGQWHPEEWQALVHERDWAQARDNPHLWGTFLWNMFDFASANRNEGANSGVNDKGLVTEDRKIRKDAFFFYEANWTTSPMVYITSRRMTPRKIAETEVKVYSNCDKVALQVNGKSLGEQTSNASGIFRWENIRLSFGTNQIEAVGTSQNTQVQDACKWELIPGS